jgi:hypothetical protein
MPLDAHFWRPAVNNSVFSAMSVIASLEPATEMSHRRDEAYANALTEAACLTDKDSIAIPGCGVDVSKFQSKTRRSMPPVINRLLSIAHTLARISRSCALRIGTRLCDKLYL